MNDYPINPECLVQSRGGDSVDNRCIVKRREESRGGESVDNRCIVKRREESRGEDEI